MFIAHPQHGVITTADYPIAESPRHAQQKNFPCTVHPQKIPAVPNRSIPATHYRSVSNLAQSIPAM